VLLALQDGETFKASLAYEPYFYVGVSLSALSRAREVTAALERKFEGLIAGISTVEKEDLEMLNHLSGRRREYLQLRFRSVGELSTVKGQLKPLIERAQAAMRAGDGMGEEVSIVRLFFECCCCCC
jgi:DNA polymerase epsilon subunit 1